MSSEPIEQRRKVFKQYKEDVKERGKPFYPYAMLHDSLMSGVVVCVIIGLAVVWKWTTPGHHTGVAIVDGHATTDNQGGWLGKLIDDPADPGTTSFVPRPDWYFYFLFYLLRIFKWPESVLLGTIGVPTICLILLLAMPFVDRRAERRPSRRPVAMTAAVLAIISMGVLTYKGAIAKESLGSELVVHVPQWAAAEGYSNNPQALAGAKLFAESGCTNCHTYNGDGGHNLGAPELTAEGARPGRTVAFEIAHLKCPSCVNAGSPMPSFKLLGQADLTQLAEFLVASKGDVAKSSK
jgi:mono/diheme cytochrome c family protein